LLLMLSAPWRIKTRIIANARNPSSAAIFPGWPIGFKYCDTAVAVIIKSLC